MGWNHQQGQKEFPCPKNKISPGSDVCGFILPSSHLSATQVAAEKAVEIDQEYTSISDQVQVNDWVVVSHYCFIFIPIWDQFGKWPNLTSILFKGVGSTTN